MSTRGLEPVALTTRREGIFCIKIETLCPLELSFKSGSDRPGG